MSRSKTQSLTVRLPVRFNTNNIPPVKLYRQLRPRGSPEFCLCAPVAAGALVWLDNSQQSTSHKVLPATKALVCRPVRKSRCLYQMYINS
jgi:hypothetical protein